MSEGFFNRWSERKRKASLGQSLPPEPVPAATPAAPATATPPAARPRVPDWPTHPPPSAGAAPQAQLNATEPAQPAAPLPTLEQAQRLTPESDFSAFAARGVAPEVRNLAMKKLFGDPRFNVMDGMDVYIDDYSNLQPPTPEQMRSLVAAQTMQLFNTHPAQSPGAESVPVQPLTQHEAVAIGPAEGSMALGESAQTSQDCADPDKKHGAAVPVAVVSQLPLDKDC